MVFDFEWNVSEQQILTIELNQLSFTARGYVYLIMHNPIR